MLPAMDPTAYERHLVPVLFRPLAEALTAAAGPVDGAEVLDVACGTGVVARRVAAAAGRTTGLDSSPAMLRVAEGLDSRVRWVTGDAASLPMPDRSVDVAFCQQGLQFTADPAAVLAELHRVLRPGGRLAVALWCDIARAPGFAALAAVLDRHEQPGDMMRRPFRLGAAGPVRDLLAAAGFTAVRCGTCVIAARFPSAAEFYARQVAASPLAAALAGLSAVDEAAIVGDLGEALADRVDDDGLVFPAESHLFTARAGQR